MVKTKPGMGDDYLKTLAKTFKAANDEAKKQGIISDYKILSGDAATQQDFDLLLMVEYPNMAALDGLREKTEPIFDKIIGNEDQQRQIAVKRVERSEEHTSELQSLAYLVCRLLLEKKKNST